MPGTLHGLEWTLLATVGPLVIGSLVIAWAIWKGRESDEGHALTCGHPGE